MKNNYLFELGWNHPGFHRCEDKNFDKLLLNGRVKACLRLEKLKLNQKVFIGAGPMIGYVSSIEDVKKPRGWWDKKQVKVYVPLIHKTIEICAGEDQPFLYVYTSVQFQIKYRENQKETKKFWSEYHNHYFSKIQ